MPHPDPNSRPVMPAVFYRDALKMFQWLQAAFGFEPSLLITNADGSLGHAQLAVEGGLIIVGGEWSEDHRSPASVGGKNTQSVHIHLSGDADAHCARARAAGAEIIQEPADQFYGDRTWRARDPEGHIWTVAQSVEIIEPADWQMPEGLKAQTFETK